MGDEIPMKKLLILPILTTAIYASATSRSESLIAEYKNMFQKIGEKREGVDASKIDALKAPFVKVAKNKVIRKDGKVVEKHIDEGFKLQAIFNQSAKISGKWYALNGEVNGMKLVSVKENQVWLKNEDYSKKLTMGSKNEKISIK